MTAIQQSTENILYQKTLLLKELYFKTKIVYTSLKHLPHLDILKSGIASAFKTLSL